MKYLLIAAVLGMGAVPVFSALLPFDSFAYQNLGSSQVLLGPGLNPLIEPWNPHDGQPILMFGTAVYTPGPIVYSAKLDLPVLGVNLISPTYTDDCPVTASACIELVDWNVPISYHVTPGILTVTMNQIIATYDFQYQTPSPEPTTLVLVLTGFAGVRFRAARRVAWG